MTVATRDPSKDQVAIAPAASTGVARNEIDGLVGANNGFVVGAASVRRGASSRTTGKDGNRLLINGRIPVNPHGGALSEGGTQGSGHTREAVHQLQGIAGERQVVGADKAMLLLGGFFFNAQGAVLRRG